MIPHPVGSLRKPVHRWVWTVLVSLVAGASAATAMLEHGLATTLGFGLGCAAVAGAIVVKVMRASMRRKPVVTGEPAGHTRLAGRDPAEGIRVALAGPDSRRVQALSDRELCLAWQISTLALTELQHRGDIANQAAMIGLRQAYLDEFSIRRRVGFEQWLSAGAWPGGDSRGPNALP